MAWLVFRKLALKALPGVHQPAQRAEAAQFLERSRLKAMYWRSARMARTTRMLQIKID